MLGAALAVAALYCGSPRPGYAQGGPPMLTDDPGTPGSSSWEINVAYGQENTDQAHVHSVPHVDVNYGLGERIQLKYETAWLRSAPTASGQSESGVDDSLLGLKWRFLDRERAGFDMSVYPQLQIENSGSSVARGVAEPGPNLFLPVEVGLTVGRAKLVGEVGYQYFDARENEWVIGLLSAFRLSEKRELLAELRGVGRGFLDQDDVILNVGLRQELGSRLRLAASVGTGLTHGEDTTSLTAYVGIQLLLNEK